ncbi:MAG: serine/threonine protein kinase [Pseudonocardia sp.]|nr:serine/threonine protein kinase [Pseudonocardia sp.]
MGAVTPTRVIGGRYVVLAELGRGGMGIVWRAEDRMMGRQVAVKELHLPDGLGPDDRRLFRERLLREARTAGRLNDPAIVTVYDVVSDGGVDHIVMELIDAPTLSDVVARSGPLSEAAATEVARRLLGALRTAHERGVVHRDVKPSNVMLGADGRVTLTDFGIAQAADDPRLTTTGSLVGSPGYMAPERLDDGHADPASDLWSLGATLWYAVQGRGPFSRDTTAATIAAVINAEVPTTRTRGPLGAVVAGLLQRDPRARLTGVQAAALLSGEPPTPPTGLRGTVTTRAVTAPANLAPPARRRWPALVVVALLALAVGLGAGLLWPRATPGPAVFTYGEGGDIPAVPTLSAGCLQGQLAVGRQYTSSASCSDPHDVEIFDSLELFDHQLDMPYPGRETIAAGAGSACALDFSTGRIVGPDKAKLRVAALVPSAAAFAYRSSPTSSFSTRSVLCALYAADGTQITGSRIATPA